MRVEKKIEIEIPFYYRIFTLFFGSKRLDKGCSLVYI